MKIFDGIYVMMPQFFEKQEAHEKYDQSPSVPEGFVYRSDVNDAWLDVEQLHEMIKG